MSRELKKKYALVITALIISALLSLFLRLDFSNASLILKELRVPRLLTAFGVGSALSIAGLMLQTTLANPLAEPYTLGIASGAALGAAIGSSLGLKLPFMGLNFGAVLGAVMVLLILLRLTAQGSRKSDSMILLGIMVSLTCASLLSIWMVLSDPVGVQSVTFWLLGDLSRVGQQQGVKPASPGCRAAFFSSRFSGPARSVPATS